MDLQTSAIRVQKELPCPKATWELGLQSVNKDRNQHVLKIHLPTKNRASRLWILAQGPGSWGQTAQVYFTGEETKTRRSQEHARPSPGLRGTKVRWGSSVTPGAAIHAVPTCVAPGSGPVSIAGGSALTQSIHVHKERPLAGFLLPTPPTSELPLGG